MDRTKQPSSQSVSEFHALRWNHAALHNLLTFIFCWLLAPAPLANAQNPPTPTVAIRHSTDAQQQGSQRPWLVTFVFDESGSMLQKDAGESSDRWTIAVRDASIKLRSLQTQLKSFDLRVHYFSTKASEWRSPLGERVYTIASASDVEAVLREIQNQRKPIQGQATNLWKSLDNILASSRENNIAANYSGLILSVFSDGVDSIPSDGPDQRPSRTRKASMLKSLEQVRSACNLRLSWTAIGPDINQLFLQELGAIGDVLKLGEAIPLPINEIISADPRTIFLPPLTKSLQTADIAIDLSSLPDAQRKGAAFKLAKSNGIFEIKQLTGSLQLKRLIAGDEGSTVRVTCSVPAAASAQNQTRLVTDFEVAVQSLKRIPNNDSWGLPLPCSQVDDLPFLVLLTGEPLHLSAATLPPSATVSWNLDGKSAGSERALDVQRLEPGMHVVTLVAKTADDEKHAEVRVLVIEPALTISGPAKFAAGDQVVFKAELPAYIPTSMRPRGQCFHWLSQSPTPISTDGSFTMSFDSKGSGSVSVNCELNCCGQKIVLSGRRVFDIDAGPAVRLDGGDLARGVATTIRARITKRNQIADVLFSVGEGASQTRAVIVPDPTEPDSAFAEFEVTPGNESTLTIVALPVLKNDSGKPRDKSDPACQSRKQSAQFRVTDPEITLSMSKPSPGAGLRYGETFEIQIKPIGADASIIDQVRITISSAAGQTQHTLAQQSDWTQSVKPAVSMGASLTIHAEAVDKGGVAVMLTEAFEDQTFQLTAAKPEIHVTQSGGGSGPVVWTGRGAEPPLIAASIVVAGTDSPYPAEEIREVRWACTNGLLQIDPDKGEAATANFRITAAGSHTITADITLHSGERVSLPVTIVAAPAPVKPNPALVDAAFESTSPAELSHENTSGAWERARVRFRLRGQEWQTLPETALIEPSPPADAEVEFEVWYQPWGQADSVTPWADSSARWVSASPLTSKIIKPRNWFICGLVILGALIATAFSIWLSLGHGFRWSKVKWSKSPFGVAGQTPAGGWNGATGRGNKRFRYSFLARKVRLELPLVRDEPSRYGWTQQARGAAGQCKAFIEWNPDEHAFVVDGHDTSRAEANVGNGGDGYRLKVTAPLNLQGPSTWSPLYVWITPESNSAGKNLMWHVVGVMCGGSILSWAVFFYLFHNRII